MHIFSEFRVCILLVSWGAVWLAAAQNADANDVARFSAMLADGSRVAGENLTEWHGPGASPLLDGRNLFDPGNPLRWLRDRSLMPGPTPTAYVETALGDRLPGSVVNFVSINPTSYDLLPSHFVVQPTGQLHLPTTADAPQVIRVVERFVRRIVWAGRDKRQYQPGTAFYRDGRSVGFRSLSFGDDYVDLLLNDGRHKALFHELAEIHFPIRDLWDAYFDELVHLCPDEATRVLQMETIDGLIVTGSMERFSATAKGNPADSNQWLHGLHPAWSLDPLWVLCGDVWIRRMFLRHEVPLSRVAPVSSRQSSLISGATYAWRTNRNVRGAPLRNAAGDFGWGFGARAFAELEFALPPFATSFQTQVGLDQLAGQGGCIRARVFLGSADAAPIWQSDFLVGAATAASTGSIALPSGETAHRLVLQFDPAHEGRPPGADPLDIRDFAAWFDPIVILDKTKLRDELRRRFPQQVLAWQGWEFSTSSKGDIVWKNYDDKTEAVRGASELAVAAIDEPFSLRRKVKLDAQDNWLMLFVDSVRSANKPPRIEVRADGEAIFDMDVPVREFLDRDVSPVAVPLKNYRRANGDAVELEIIQTVAHKSDPVRWHAIQIVNQLPTLYELLEDDGEFAALEIEPVAVEQRGRVEWSGDDRHSGARAVKVTPAGQFARKFDGDIPIRETPGWGEYRFLRFAFRKFGAGRVCLELKHEQSADRPIRYDAGLGDPSWGKANRVWVQQLPGEWIVMTRDLFADFGVLDITSLALSAPDGEYAMYDHIYLARTPADFDAIPEVPSPETTNQKARRELARPLLDAALPATVAINMPDGRGGTGVLVSAEGNILTAGHIIVRPDQEIKVRLADGRLVNAKTRGVFREMDVGLVTITDAGSYPFIAVGVPDEIPPGKLYLGVAHNLTVTVEDRPAAHLLDIRRVFRGTIWTTFDVADLRAGGPLVDQNGLLIGIHSRRSNFGGFLYSRLNEVVPQLERLKAGEVWGKWHPGTGPMMGVEVTTVKEGCRVTSVFDKTPAASAGLQVDDIIRQVEGRSVVSLDDIYELLADNDPGDEVEIELLRGQESKTTKIKLEPRIP